MKKPNRNSSAGESYEAEEFSVNFIPHKSGTYTIEIDDVIESVKQFSTAISVLENATEDDDIIIKIQTPGGLFDAADALVHAIRKCVAPIHFIATGTVASAGTMILLEGTSFELSKNFVALLHNGGSGAVGNLNEYFVKAEFDKKHTYKAYWDIYQGFLTEEEFDGLMRGDNIWLDAEEWCKRYEARNAYFVSLIDGMQENPVKVAKPRKKKEPVLQTSEQ